MSFYNMLHGFSPDARIVLAMLDKTPGDFGRFRDAWIEPGGKVLCVFTRCGGGNRDDYGEVFEMFESMPGFLDAEDDDYDCTYCTFRFAVPERYADLAAKLAPESPRPSLMERTNAVIESLGTTPPSGVGSDRVGEIVAAIKSAVEGERAEKEGRA